MGISLVNQPPSKSEMEQLRLILSTYQDGSGMLATENGGSLPGWRDFERAVAVVFGGINQENKSIFDVLIPDPTNISLFYGVSCKMRSELKRVSKDGRITIELSNSSKKFKDYIYRQGVSENEYRHKPTEVGIALVQLIEQWKEQHNISRGGNIDLSQSCYLSLLYDRITGEFQLFWIPIQLPDPTTLNWYYTVNSKSKQFANGGHLNGDDDKGRLFEWYGDSGGQLKYYPQISSAKWISSIFHLESIPQNQIYLGLKMRAQSYFPDLWQKSNFLQ